MKRESSAVSAWSEATSDRGLGPFVVAGLGGAGPAAAVTLAPLSGLAGAVLVAAVSGAVSGVAGYVAFKIPRGERVPARDALIVLGGYRYALQTPLLFLALMSVLGVALSTRSSQGAAVWALVLGLAASAYASPVAMTVTSCDERGVRQVVGWGRPREIVWADVSKVSWSERVIRGPKGLPLMMKFLDFKTARGQCLLRYSMSMGLKDLELVRSQARLQLDARKDVAWEETSSVSRAARLGF